MSTATPAALDGVLARLACPRCGSGLGRTGDQVGCGAGHRFDVARQGYLSLVAGAAPLGGDTAPMVAARQDFLDGGHYTPVVAALGALAARHAAPSWAAPTGLVADVAGGTGWYLARLLDERAEARGVVLDSSVPALRRAARAHPRVAAVGCDVTVGLPLRDGSVDLVLSVFGPRPAAELERVLAPGALLLVVTPAPEHLQPLVETVGMVGVDAAKPERLATRLSRFELVETLAVRTTLELTHEDVVRVVSMGPSAHHLGADVVHQRVAVLPDPCAVELAVEVAAYRAPAGGGPA